MAEAEENVKAAEEVVEEKAKVEEKAAEEEDDKPAQFKYMCTESQHLEDMSQKLKAWRKLGKNKENGDWVMITTEPLGKKQSKFKFVWIASPEHPGKGGPEVACRAAWIALMYGRCFDIGLDVKTKEAKQAALDKDPTSFPLFHYPNGKMSARRPKEDESDVEEEEQWWGTPVIFFVRYKNEIYSADTLTDGASLNTKIRMKWATNKKELLQSSGIQERFHMKKLEEGDLVNGKTLFKQRWQKNKDALK